MRDQSDMSLQVVCSQGLDDFVGMRSLKLRVRPYRRKHLCARQCLQAEDLGSRIDHGSTTGQVDWAVGFSGSGLDDNRPVAKTQSYSKLLPPRA